MQKMSLCVNRIRFKNLSGPAAANHTFQWSHWIKFWPKKQFRSLKFIFRLSSDWFYFKRCKATSTPKKRIKHQKVHATGSSKLLRHLTEVCVYLWVYLHLYQYSYLQYVPSHYCFLLFLLFLWIQTNNDRFKCTLWLNITTNWFCTVFTDHIKFLLPVPKLPPSMLITSAEGKIVGKSVKEI